VFLYFFPKVEKRTGLRFELRHEPRPVIGLNSVGRSEWMFFAKGLFENYFVFQGAPMANNNLQVRDIQIGQIVDPVKYFFAEGIVSPMVEVPK
jgi:hypothetical protein